MLLSLLGHRFWIPAYIALVLGLFMPGEYAWLAPAVPYALGGILFFTCLKIPFGAVVGGLRDPVLLRRASWMTVLKLVALPSAAWALTWLIAPDWAAGIGLVMGMSAGMSTVAFTDLHRGDRVLALFLTAVTSLVVPLTVPAGMALVHPGPAPDAGLLAHQAAYIIAMLAIPFTAAQTLRRLAPRLIARGMAWWGRLAIVSLIVMVLISLLANRSGWAAWGPARMLVPLGLTCLATLLSLGLLLALRGRVPGPSLTAFACACIYMNNGLAIVYATRFHPGEPYVILPCVLMQAPMLAGVVLWGRWAEPHAGEDATT